MILPLIIDNGDATAASNTTAAVTATGNVISNDTDVDTIANGETRAVSGVATGHVANAVGAVGASVTGTYGSLHRRRWLVCLYSG